MHIIPENIKLDSFYAIDGGEVLKIYRCMKRLYSENTMTGDDMRNFAQSLDMIEPVCIDVELAILTAFEKENTNA